MSGPPIRDLADSSRSEPCRTCRFFWPARMCDTEVPHAAIAPYPCGSTVADLCSACCSAS
eukprot:4699103-Heterocapsa_arctica.AAC.1